MAHPVPVPEHPEIAVWRLVPAARPVWQPGLLKFDEDLGGWGWDDTDGPEDLPKDLPRALWTPPLVDAHTHLGDAFLRPERDRLPRDLHKLVAPPHGYKHRRLQETHDDTIGTALRERAEWMAEVGTAHAMDFREGGADGLRLLLQATEHTGLQVSAFGRPAGRTEDPDAWIREVETLLDAPTAGIGISGIRDLPTSLQSAAADACRAARKPLGLHLSEGAHEDVEAALALQPALAVHLCQATRSDLQRLADDDVLAVSCPSSNAFFGFHPPLARLHEANVNHGLKVAFGTDNAMLSNGDLRDEARRAAKALPAVPVAWWLEAATWTPWVALDLGPPTDHPGLLWGVHRKVPATAPDKTPLERAASLWAEPPRLAPKL